MSLLESISRLFPHEPAMRRRSVMCAGPMGGRSGLHRMSYTEWGEPDNPRVLICVHGLTRNCRDFDYLAAHLGRYYRVICPDVAGRGQSDWLEDKAEYSIPLYAQDMITLIARLNVEQVDWVGTSMGGLIGMAIAAQPRSPIRNLVLNDVGPIIATESLHRIAEYVGKAPVFANLQQAEAYVRAVSATFGPLTDEQWRHLTEHSLRLRQDNTYEMVYDPGIAYAFSMLLADVDLWPYYEAIRARTMAIRGAESDLLRADTHQEMGQRGPKAELVEIAGVGHAPMLMDEHQIGLVGRFLLGAEYA